MKNLTKKWVIIIEKLIKVEPNEISIYCPCYLGARNPSSSFVMLFGDSYDLQFAIANAKTHKYPKFMFNSKKEAEEYIRLNKIDCCDERKAKAAMYFVRN